MMVYEAKIDLEGPNGSRTIPLADLYRDDGMDHLNLEQDELLVSIRLPKAGPKRFRLTKNPVSAGPSTFRSQAVPCA